MQRFYKTHAVPAGNVVFGGGNEILLQSMTNTITQSIDETVAQCIRIFEAGAHLVRISAKHKKDLDAIYTIKQKLRQQGFSQPLIADIHFSASLSVLAARVVEKVRINPGNFYNAVIGDDDNKYYDQIRKKIRPLLDTCTQHNVAIRVGTNHGSLSRRIIEKYGTGAQAMAEASMEFVRIIADAGFRNLVLSVKASNASENIIATRLLAELQQKEGYSYPLHLGVTEAGLGFSGRIKSAAGIGALLADGIGDTIRVSLTEAPENEIPVARQLAGLFVPDNNDFPVLQSFRSLTAKALAPSKFLIIASRNFQWLPGLLPDTFAEDLQNNSEIEIINLNNCNTFANNRKTIVIETKGKNALYDFKKIYINLFRNTLPQPVIWKRISDNSPDFQLRFAAELGNLLSSNVLCGCWIEGNEHPLNDSMMVLYEILQVFGIRTTHAEFISCPSCSRTSFDIIHLAEEVRSRTYHYKGLTIAVMGCIVNGPGEMGAADYGLLGQSNGLLSLYVKGSIVDKNLSIKDACNRLIEEIEKNL